MLAPADAPNPATIALVDNACEHSAGAVVNAAHIAFPIASGVLPTETSTPFITNVGLPPIPNSAALLLSFSY